MKKLIFYNHFHCGDLHVSRSFINDIKSRKKIDMMYYHQNDFEILKDIKIEQCNKLNNDFIKDKNLYEIDNILYFNTWYYSVQESYKKYGCSLKTLYINFSYLYEKIGLELLDMSNYIPEINFSEYNISNVDLFFKNNKFSKYVFVSNGNVLSGQSKNFDFDPIIDILSDKYKNILFLMSNKSNIKKSNVIQTRDIINKSGNDLNENSYISTFCDLIIGRSSGSFTFSIIKENIFNNKLKYIDISNIDPKFGLDNCISNDKFIEIKDYDMNIILNKIQNIL